MSHGRKRRFGAAGITNVLITNLVLQSLLLIPSLPASLCTLTSQIINGCIGYTVYRSWVFRARGHAHLQGMPRYVGLLSALWLMNWGLINAGITLGLQRNLSALIMVPLLALCSYLGQKHWVFKA